MEPSVLVDMNPAFFFVDPVHRVQFNVFLTHVTDEDGNGQSESHVFVVPTFYLFPVHSVCHAGCSLFALPASIVNVHGYRRVAGEQKLCGTSDMVG